jgi:hypothetical protein
MQKRQSFDKSSRRNSIRSFGDEHHEALHAATTAEGGNANGNTRANRRRISHVDPNVQVSDITGPRLYLKKPPKSASRNDLFHFHCQGEIQPASSSKDPVPVRWEAKFDRPLEQLIYPSLQRFDNEAFEKKRQLFRSLHGSSESGGGGGLNKLHVGDHGHIPDHFDEGLQLDFIPGGEVVQENILFLFSPKWSVEVGRPVLKGTAAGVKSSLNTARSVESATSVATGCSPLSPKQQQQQHFLDADESFVQGNAECASLSTHRSSRVSEAPSAAFSSSPPHTLHTSNSARLSVSSEQSFHYLPLVDEDLYSTTERLLDVEGERFLRLKIREKYEDRRREDENLLRAQAELNDPFHVAIVRSRAGANQRLPSLQNDGDQLVNSLSLSLSRFVDRN